MDYRTVLLHLTLIENIGPGTVGKLCAAVPRENLPNIYDFSVSDYIKLGLTQTQANHIVQGLSDRRVLEQELKLIEQHAVTLLTITDDHYPHLLRNIHLPPAILYTWGAPLTDNEHHLALVGARKADGYCAKVLDDLLPPLIASNFVMVSGGARGADSMVHLKTLEHGGRTVVVIGSGLLRPYPPENRKLFSRVIESGGSVISIFPMKAAPLPGNFPARNRVISGLSRGVLVLQAAERSGALITAEFALEQGREVMAVPGSLDHELSKGPHNLIKQGAHLISCADDVFEIFEFQPPQQSFIPLKPKIQLSPEQETILDACQIPRSIDELAFTTKMDRNAVYDLLFNLQLEGIIEQNHAGLWQQLA